MVSEENNKQTESKTLGRQVSEVVLSIDSGLNKVGETLKGIVAEKYPDFPGNQYVYTYRNNYQLIPLTYSQRIKEKYIKEAPDKDAEQLEGKICFNLCSDEESLNKLLEDEYLK